MAGEGVGIEFGSAADGGEEVGDVGLVVLGLRGDFDRLGFVLGVEHLDFAAAAEEHLAAGAVELRSAVHVVRIDRVPQPLLVNEHPAAADFAVAGIFKGDLLSVGEFLVVVLKVFAAECDDFGGMRLHAEPPAGVVDVVDAVVPHVAGAEVIPPGPALVDAVGAIGNLGRRPDPGVIIKAGGWRGILPPANAAAALVAAHNPASLEQLGTLPHNQDGFGPTLEDVRRGLIGKIGENMSFRRFRHFGPGASLASYLHGTRIGVVVEYTGDEASAKDVAMHVAAMKPVALSSADVPPELVARERSVAAAKAAEDAAVATAAGKAVQSAEIVAKRIEGGVQKYLREVSLFDQTFVKNDKQTVGQMLKANNTTVTGFTLYIVGEGIEKRVDDFAAEVAAQVALAKKAP